MTDTVSFSMLQTMARKAFDPETISVVVGVVTTAKRWRVTIRDEISKLEHIFHVNAEHTIGEVEAFIKEAAAKLNLVEGPDKIGDQIVDEKEIDEIS